MTEGPLVDDHFGDGGVRLLVVATGVNGEVLQSLALGDSEWVSEWVSACECECVWDSAHARVCLCVWERERVRERVCLCVFVCVPEVRVSGCQCVYPDANLRGTPGANPDTHLDPNPEPNANLRGTPNANPWPKP